jgi:hypothetical protein
MRLTAGRLAGDGSGIRPALANQRLFGASLDFTLASHLSIPLTHMRSQAPTTTRRTRDIGADALKRRTVLSRSSSVYTPQPLHSTAMIGPLIDRKVFP